MTGAGTLERVASVVRLPDGEVGRREQTVSVTLESGEAGSRVVLEGSIDITDAGELKAALVTAIQVGAPVAVTLAEASYLDVTAMQLLWAAGRAARTAEVRMEMDGTVPEPVRTALTEAGISLFAAE